MFLIKSSRRLVLGRSSLGYRGFASKTTGEKIGIGDEPDFSHFWSDEMDEQLRNGVTLDEIEDMRKALRKHEKAQLIYKKPRVSWQNNPRRTGLLGMKVGMTCGFDKYGMRYPLTVIMFENSWVTQVKTEETDGFNAIQVGGFLAKEKNVKKPQRGHCSKNSVPLCKHFTEFRVTEEGLLPIGTPLGAWHFVPGQFVDIQGTSIGKGFQGPMKRWGFAGQGASHGVSKAHRSHGSTGQCQDPGKTFKNKKMAGRMGGKTVTKKNSMIFKIDVERNLIYVKGAVPGNKGGLVRVRDAFQKQHILFNGETCDLPFPTRSVDECVGEQVWMSPDPKGNYLEHPRGEVPRY